MKKYPQLLTLFLSLFLFSKNLPAQNDPCVGISPVIIPTNPICFGSPDGKIDIPNIQNITPPYTITMGDKMATSLVRFVGLLAGEYTIFIEDAIDCTFSTTIELVEADPFILDLGEDVTVDLGNSVTLKPTANKPIIEFQRPQVDGDSCLVNCFDPIILPTTSDYYKLAAVSDDGCLATDSIFIHVNPIRKVYIPNIFSPNGDGNNDVFAIYSQQPNVQKITEVAVFDRWGNQLFIQINQEGIGDTNFWDGRYRGQLVERGAYLYYAKMLFLDGVEEVISGTVSVIY